MYRKLAYIIASVILGVSIAVAGSTYALGTPIQIFGGGTGATSTSAALQNLGVFNTEELGNDINPAVNLSNLVGKTSATICIVGDSTATVGPAAGYTPDPSQVMWGMIQNELRSQNPQIASTTWTFDNFAIGATNEANFLETGDTMLGLGNTNINSVSTPWFTNTANTWASYVQAANCDVLFYDFGTNTPTSGDNGGTSVATFIRKNFENIETWATIPNIILITPKYPNYAYDGSGDDSRGSAHQAQAAFKRTFAESDGGGYTSFPLIQQKGIGLLDLGRYFTARVASTTSGYGYDPALQYFQSMPWDVQNNVAVTTGGRGFVSDATTIATSTDGDFRMTVELLAAGGTTLYNYGGGNALYMSAGEWTNNYFRFIVGGTGTIITKYIQDGGISTAPVIVGASTPTTLNDNIWITVTASQDHEVVQISGNGGLSTTTALDIYAPRMIGGETGGTPINFGFNSAPTGSPTMNITEAWTGIAEPMIPSMTINQAYGLVGTACTVTQQGCQGGNTQNHVTTYAANLDGEVIRGMNWHVPSVSVYATNGFSGIGTSTPSSQLFVTTPTQMAATNSIFTVASTTDLSLLTVLGNGNIGIGTTSPWGLLSVNANNIGTAPQFVIGSSTETDFIVANNGDVGIGTTSPTSLLEVDGTTPDLSIHNTANGTQNVILNFKSDYFNLANTSHILSSLVSSPDSATGGKLLFETTAPGGTLTERMRINANGVVGIGSSTPWATLAVNPVAGAINDFVVGSSTATSFIVNNGGFVGIGTSTPFALLSIVAQAFSGNTRALFAVASSTTAGSAMPNFEIDQNGHVVTSGPQPALSTCGTSPSITGNDTAGVVTVGSVSASSCTITFANAYPTAPECIVENQSGSITNSFSYTVSASAIVVSETALTSDILDYQCNGLQ